MRLIRRRKIKTTPPNHSKIEFGGKVHWYYPWRRKFSIPYTLCGHSRKRFEAGFPKNKEVTCKICIKMHNKN